MMFNANMPERPYALGPSAPTSATALHLIACVAQKEVHALPARQLYRSDWFRKARRYVDSWGLHWMILSAEYGLVHPDQVIEPYDRSLSSMTASDRARWGAGVVEQLRTQRAPDQLVFFAGRLYREPLMKWAGNRAQCPLAHKGIGEQKQWLSAHTLRERA